MSRIGFIGTGHIAAPMVRFLADRGHSVIVSRRNADVAAHLSETHGVETADNQTVLDRCDIVFLCLRPHIAEDVISGLEFRSDHQVVSVMAGIGLATLGSLCAPATAISMTIPLGFLEHGGCPLPACPTDAVLQELFAPENPVFPVADEAAFNQHFAVCAFVPGVLDLMISATQWLGQTTGDVAQAELYTHQLLSEFLQSISNDNTGFLMQERDALATEGTLSLMMTDGLQSAGAHDALHDSLTRIGARLGGQQ